MAGSRNTPGRTRAILAIALAGLLAGATLFPAIAASGQYQCTGTIVTTDTGADRQRVERREETTVFLEVEARRILLLSENAFAALDIRSTETVDGRIVYRFGGIGGDYLYAGRFSAPDFRLRALASDEGLKIEISMRCVDAGPPLLY